MVASRKGGIMSNELAVRNDIGLSQLGTVLAQCGYFADARQEAQAIVKVLAGQELGFGPIASMTGIYIVKGRVTLSANLMAAAVKRSNRYDYRVLTLTDQECDLAFSENGELLGHSSFTMDDAKRAGLNSQTWTAYPRNMLFSRAISNGVKIYCPDVTNGPAYTPDELGATVDGATGEIVIEAEVVEEPHGTFVLSTEPMPRPQEPKHAEGAGPTQPTDKRPSANMLAAWDDLWGEANALDMFVQPIAGDATATEVARRGAELREQIAQRKADLAATKD